MRTASEDRYVQYVWPPPPDEARIQLVDVFSSRAEVEGTSSLSRRLIGASPASPFDRLIKPFGVAFDTQGRVLVTDSATAALIRFDRAGRRMDVFGTRGRIRLKLPLGLHVATDGTVYVADATLAQVVAFDVEGNVAAVFGRAGDLVNPTDATLSPNGERLYVADSRAHQIVVFDIESGSVVSRLGGPGSGEGEFSYPTSLAFGPDGSLFIVDQMNARVQLLDADGEYVDTLGGRGVGFADFVRPKDVAVDDNGYVYVTDNAFNNVQLFDVDFALLTFVGEGGLNPGQFQGASGVAVQGDRFAVVDQIGHRVQVFRFLTPPVAAGSATSTGSAGQPLRRTEGEAVLVPSVTTEQGSRSLEQGTERSRIPASTEAAAGTEGRRAETESEQGIDLSSAPSEEAAVEPPTPVPASRLNDVRVQVEVDGVAILLSGDGAFKYRAFSLADPFRFVMDLIGVMNGLEANVVPVNEQVVKGVRIAQYKAEPELVTRVVVDLVDGVSPVLEPDGMQLGMRFDPAHGELTGSPGEDLRAVKQVVGKWEQAWEDQRIEDYLACYSDSFNPSGGMDRLTWESRRRELVAAAQWIDIQVEGLQIEKVGENRVVVSFDQSYASNLLTDRVIKKLELVLEGEWWKIARESVGQSF